MCFSAAASIGAGAVLSIGGIYALSVTRNRKYLPLAATPLLFGIQQLAEGGVWLGLNGHIGQQTLVGMIYVFLFFSQIFWPTWVPFLVRYAEKKGPHKKIISIFLLLGILLSLYLIYTLFIKTATASIQEHHIVYEYSPLISSLKWISVAIYIVVTIVPLLISKVRGLKILGVGLTVTGIIAYLFYTQAFISVWCFFAAIISAYIIYFVRRIPRE